MALSNDLLSQFAKLTNKKNDNSKKETTVYGTVIDSNHVQIDGSNVTTPISSTTTIKAGQRVTVLVKDHSAIITGNLTDNSASSSDVNNINNQLNNLNVESVIAEIAKIGKLETDKLDAKTADITYAKISSLDATNANITSLTSDYGSFKELTTNKFTAVEGDIKTLTAEKLSAKDIEGLYANIDFSNIGEAAVQKLFAASGIIEDLTMSNGVVTGKLTSVTVHGDLIEGGTIVANKLVIQGSDGLYYKLNTDGATVEAEQTEYNSLNGNVILAQSITASKIDVDDLVAFNATIGGFKMDNTSIYSGVKSGINNTTQGIYLDSTGQMNIGDASYFLKYYKDGNSYKLAIAAESLSFGINKKDVATEIGNAAKTATNYLNVSDAGLVVGDLTAGTLGNNVLIDSDSVDIRNGSQVRASFGSDYLYLAKHSRNARIDLCNGLVNMYHESKYSYDSLFVIDTAVTEILGNITPLCITSTDDLQKVSIQFANANGVMGGIGMTSNVGKDGWLRRIGKNMYDMYTVLDSGNFHDVMDGGWIAGGVIGENFTLYDNDYQIQYRKIGKIVEIRGVVKPTKAIPGSSDNHTIFTLMEGYRPSKYIYEVCQGTGACSWLLSITTGGVVRFARYNDGTKFVDTTVSTWLPFHVTFFVD